MTRPDPTVVFFLALLCWGIGLVLLVSSFGCGGGPPRCRGADAQSISKGSESRCGEVPR